ncbi:hypothetical protein JCM19241_4455 [Vibrio ishigakensis]|uniref:Uncharacterized protein n=1 Tax=Vibrio ishigakensis TaxID=1481914 RepID=A0A0B8QGS2_9VIBR|nr:hypothetical protein JCM19241_4455 [Vibrio ishigakensis]
MNLKVTVITSLVVAFAPAVSAADAPSFNDLFGSSILIAENRSGNSNDMRGHSSKPMADDSMVEAYESKEMDSEIMNDSQERGRIHHKRA